MAIDREDVEKIIVGILGVGALGAGVAALINRVIDNGESYESTHEEAENEEQMFFENEVTAQYVEVPSADEIFEQERVQREMNSMWDERQVDQLWTDYRNGVYQQSDEESNLQAGKQELKRKNKSDVTEYIYIDFTQNLKSGSRNKYDVYQESIEEQFEKLKRKIELRGKKPSSDFRRFVNVCFPNVKSTYYISLPGFERHIETSRHYMGADCIYNMVLRPEKTGIVSSGIPKGLDIILIGDLVFRNSLISFVVKGIDLIDENVEKHGEYSVQCAALCAITKNNKNLPDYGVEGRELYKSFLTRDMVLYLCQKVYPIKHPEIAIEVFENWKRYVEFRQYFLNVQSQRNENIQEAKFVKAYAISRSDYRKNEDLYESHLLDGNKSFIQREQVLLDEAYEDSVEFPLVKVEIVRNLEEINKNLARDKKISIFERELRRFSRMQVALATRNPEVGGAPEGMDSLLYLGERVAFEAIDVRPDCHDIIQFYDDKMLSIEKQIDEKYKGIIRVLIERYRENMDAELSARISREIEAYEKQLDESLQSDIENNANQLLEKRYISRKKEITTKYDKKRKQIEKQHRKGKQGISEDEYIARREALISEEKSEIEAIPLQEWYTEHNEKCKEDYRKNRGLEKARELESLCAEKERLLRVELTDVRENEKQEHRKKTECEKQEKIRKKVARLTMRHFYIYFKAEEYEFEHMNPELLEEYRYVVYDNRAEKAKIDRQRRTLESFYRGYVKNPFLASYLFVPETLGKAENNDGEIEWFGDRLNESQKEAVRRALASNSLFLLQGPPGTGKTEVIAEITAQYVKQGKKVLVSSETHKAIDNVFDRLPKIPEIRPLRLLPSLSGKDTEYSPEKLVDNLYQGIASRLDRRILQYENFSEMKNCFSEKMRELRFKHEQTLKLESLCRDIQSEKNTLQREIGMTDTLVEEKRSSKRPLEEESFRYSSVLLCIDKCSFGEDIEKKDVLVGLNTKLYDILSEYDFFTDLDLEKIQRICRIDIEQLGNEFRTIEENTSAMSVEQEKAAIRSKINALRDPDTDEILEGKEEEYNLLRQQLIALKNAKDAESTIDYSTFSFSAVISADRLATSSDRAMILQKFVDIRSEIRGCMEAEKASIEKIVQGLNEKIGLIENEISELRAKKLTLLSRIEELNEDTSYSEFRRKQQELRKEIVDFFVEFEISEEYPADDYATAIEIIQRRWENIEKNQEALEKENKSKIPMYRAIRDYLLSEEILEEDRISYTKKLFDNANVYGMTCTSRERFSEASMRALKEYNLGEINVRNVGIDVVIIDEVSKSSFLDLMIPVLYGKTVIFVGDHRQLPPLYDLKHMRREDFDGLNPEIIDFDINAHYQEMYETCFFKELFEKVPAQYKIMLNKQYRCHSDIMDVFNHFYSTNGKGLSVGLSNQNDLKQHGLTIKRKGITLLEPHNHVYFVNCTEYESHLDAESSSIVNRQESDVICRLLKMMNEEYGMMIEGGKIRGDAKKDERKSVGVICTYRDQARLIKNSLKGQKFANFSQKREERLIINTVDDFQGDERDIIIVSMVRNPRGERYSTEFIDQFERINVALSRARCMLIIVGAQEFLSRSSIDLPDVNGNKDLDRYSFPIYREIIRTIHAKGKVLQAIDIVEEDKHGRK